jgi:cytochrome P450
MEMATCSIHRDEEIYPDGDTFDGYRFYKLRQGSEENLRRHQYVSVSSNMLGWGYGRHSCPGRFLADIEIKLFFAELLLRYDIKLTKGKSRPANMEFENVVSS